MDSIFKFVGILTGQHSTLDKKSQQPKTDPISALRESSKTTEDAANVSPEAAFMSSLPPMNLLPLWTQMSKMVPPNPNPSAVPAAWKYSEVRPTLMESGDLIGAEEAERRVLMLINPSLDAPYTTNTIYGGLQLVLPNEVAPAHRHIAFALRFIIEGERGFTAVEGKKMFMERGDVILTPSWHWHDHGNEGTEPMVWLDGLDLPLFKHAPVNFAENYSEPRYPSVHEDPCEWRHPWKPVEESLKAKSGPHRVHHYKSKGKNLSNTIGAQAEYLEAGHTTGTLQETTSYMYHVYSGTGKTHITTPQGKESTIEWTSRDTFTIPAWSKIVHVNTSTDTEAYLFAVNDIPLLENLGLHRRA